MKHRFLLTALAGAALVSTACQDEEPFSPGAVDPPSFARAEGTSFTAHFAANPIAMGEWTITGEVLHIRGLVGWGAVSGHMTGSMTAELDADLLAATGAGPSRAAVTIEVTELDGQPVVGTWEGQLRGRITGFPGPAFVHSGHFVGHGTGDLAGMKIWGDYTNEANPGASNYVLIGKILDPHGG